MSVTDSRFLFAVEYVLFNEGGNKFTNDPDDPGSATKYGITIQTLKDYRRNQNLTPEHVEDLTYEEALRIYHDRYWIGKFDGLNNLKTATKCFDMYVNLAPKAAVRLMQRAVNRFEVVKIAEDGIMGTVTRVGINVQNQANYLTELVELLKEHYWAITYARRESGKFKNPDKYIKGWLNRADKLPSNSHFKCG